LTLSPLRCLERARDLFGPHTGIVDGDRRFRYAEFADRAQRLAGALLEQGLEPGEPVAFLCRNGHVLLEAYFGVPLARGLILPLNIRLAEPELALILRHCGARFLFYAEEFAALAKQFHSPHAIQFGDRYEQMLALATQAEIGTLDENSPASLFYTSGTTAEPKGVVHSHRALYLHALSVALTFHIDDSTVELYTIPLFHANGWGRPHAATLMGARQVLLPRFTPSEVFRLIEEERVTSMCLVPTMVQALLAIEGGDVSSMKEIHLGGSAVAAELIARLEDRFRCLCTTGYGMTETGPVATTGRPKRGTPARLHQAGWPVVGVTVQVEVPQDGLTAGEVLIGGDHLMSGYWGDHARDADFLRTGDIATWDSETFLRIVDRKKEIVISGGENISAAEVESAIGTHSAVDECAVVAVPDSKWGEVPMAYVVRSAPVTEEEIVESLVSRIARFKIPKHWLFVTGPLPRTATGKIAKIKLKEIFHSPD